MDVEKLLTNRTFQIIGGVILLVVLLQVLGLLKRPAGKQFKLDPNSPSPRPAFEPENEAIAIYDMLSTWDILSTRRRKEAFNKILGYNDNELRLVENAYRKEYKSDKYNTLRKLIQSEVIITPGQKEIEGQVLLRLSAIGA